ncbi:hypothetical protein C0J52_14562 [Blattella germanica]|nr:hypothetical protein C0J52_14562 [Blattella germanica]
MVSWINATRSTYNYYVDELADHRSDHMLFMSSPWPSILISIVYIYLVWGLGPHLMKDRKPFKLDGVISTYNFVQMVLSAYLVERSFSLGWGRKYRMFCEPVDYSNDPEAINAVYGSWLYYIIKIMELLDTIFFVLRKKNNQATFLHVYHHAAQVVSSWIWVRYVPGKWPWDFWWKSQLFCPYLDVWVLLYHDDMARIQTENVVEEISDSAPNGK